MKWLKPLFSWTFPLSLWRIAVVYSTALDFTSEVVHYLPPSLKGSKMPLLDNIRASACQHYADRCRAKMLGTQTVDNANCISRPGDHLQACSYKWACLIRTLRWGYAGAIPYPHAIRAICTPACLCELLRLTHGQCEAFFWNFSFSFHGTGVKGVCVRAGVQVCGFTVSGSDWPRSENAIKRVVQKQADRKSQLSSEACASDRIVNIREHSTQITSSTDSSLQTDPTVTIKKACLDRKSD